MMSHRHKAAEANKSLDASLTSKRTKEGVPSQDGPSREFQPFGPTEFGNSASMPGFVSQILSAGNSGVFWLVKGTSS